MSEPRRAPALLGMAALTVAVAVGARAYSGPLGPDATPLYALPPLFVGLYLVVGATWMRDVGLYGTLLGGLPDLGHLLLRASGFASVGLALWVLLAQPPAGAGAVARALPSLDGYCRGEVGVRVERALMPTVDSLLALREAQSPDLRAELDAAVRACMSRCGRMARVALADPAGTHSSWRRLREWLAEHPELHDLPADDPLWGLAWRARSESTASTPAPVPVLLEP